MPTPSTNALVTWTRFSVESLFIMKLILCLLGIEVKNKIQNQADIYGRLSFLRPASFSGFFGNRLALGCGQCSSAEVSTFGCSKLGQCLHVSVFGWRFYLVSLTRAHSDNVSCKLVNILWRSRHERI